MRPYSRTSDYTKTVACRIGNNCSSKLSTMLDLALVDYNLHSYTTTLTDGVSS